MNYFLLRPLFVLFVATTFCLASVASAQSERSFLASQKSTKRAKHSHRALRAAHSAKLTRGVESDLLHMRPVMLNIGRSKVRLRPKNKRRESTGNDVVYGALDRGRGEGLFIFRKGRLAFANISDVGTNTSIQITPSQAGSYKIEEFNAAAFPRCNHAVAADVNSHDAMPTALGALGAPSAFAADGTALIDVMIVWSPEVEAARGAAGAKALAQAAIASANQAYVNSGVFQRLNLVYAGKLSQPETSNFSTMLSRLTNGTDKYYDEVHALRDKYGADLVAAIVRAKEYCGIGYMLNGSSAYGYSVTNDDCAVGNYSFVHELGHNMGSHHDRANSSGSGSYPYSYGHRFYGVSGKQHRTIMSYAPGARINLFSNPEVKFDGVPTGVVNSENNALSLNNTAPIVQAFRNGTAGTCDAVKQPTVSLSPSRQSVAQGKTATFTLTIRNNDGSKCSNGVFAITNSTPAGFTSALDSSTISIAPGGTASTTLRLTPSASSPATAYAFSVSAAKGGMSGAANGTIDVLGPDAQAPTAPSSLKASNPKGRVSLSWKASTDNVRVTGYNIYRNGTQIGSSTSTSYTDSAATAGSTYTYTVRAQDAAGNISAASNSVSLKVK